MIRAWLAVAFLSASWLFGRGYFDPAQPVWAAITVLFGLALLATTDTRSGAVLESEQATDRSSVTPFSVNAVFPGSQYRAPICFALLLPVVWLVPWPAKWIPLLLIAATLIEMSGLDSPWSRRLARALIMAGVILLVQLFALTVYAYGTARAHELPPPLAQFLGLIPRWLGIDSAVDGSWIVVQGPHQVQRFAATWELLFDPSTILFVVGGFVLLFATRSEAEEAGQGPPRWFGDRSETTSQRREGEAPAEPKVSGRFTARQEPRPPSIEEVVLESSLGACGRLCLIGLAWVPLRAAVMIALVLQRIWRADAITAPNTGQVLVNSWIHIALLLGPALLAARFLPRLGWREFQSSTELQPDQRRQWVPAGFLAAGIGLLVFVGLWSPIGVRKSGPMVFVERHSTWEPTQEPYGTTVYGEAGSYNYAAAYAYCAQYFPMARLLEDDPINDDALADCGVLIIKTPTARYTVEEIDAIERFVTQGGSLLLIGDHTNVFNMNTYLNDIGRRFGVTFRNDLLFHVGDPYRQYDPRPWPAHPILQHMPPLNFAVSCSIDPGRSPGRMVLRNEGLYNLPPAYHESNYHPQAEYRPQMQYGSWCQMWATGSGRGRVLAFADSTLFSNFCVFQPGKAELLRGMLDWLGRSSVWDRAAYRRLVQIPLGLSGIVLIVLGWRFGDRHGLDRLVLLSVGLASGVLTTQTIQVWQARAMPIPALQRPLPLVVIDRHLSEVPLFTGAFADDKEGMGYGMLEQWIPRVGNVITRSDDAAPFFGDGLVVICPTVSVSDRYLQQLKEYVQQGGRVLVFDSPDVPESTANSLLAPFGLQSIRENAEAIQGQLSWPQAENENEYESVPPLELQMSCTIQGGQPLAQVGSTPVAAQVEYGQGLVTVVGFGSLFNDAAMGFHWLPEPDEVTRQRYDGLYYLLRASLPSSANRAILVGVAADKRGKDAVWRDQFVAE